MAGTTRSRDALELCRRARPEVPADRVSADTPVAQALLEAILSTPIRSGSTAGRSPSRRRARALVGLIGSAVAAGVAVAAVALTGSGPPAGPDVTAAGPRAALVDVVPIAETSSTALAQSGRAHMAFELQAGTPLAQRGTSDVTWSGPDIEMTVHIEAHDAQPASDASTRVVDGTRYSFIGPKDGPGQWVRAGDPAPPNGGQLFDADPRTLLSVLDPAARFTEVGTETVNGVSARQLHATAVDQVPVVGLGLYPDTDDTVVTHLDLWVGPDDVVQRMDLGLRRTEAKVADAGGGTPAPSVSHDSTYSVTFFDLGAAITITAPPDAVEAEK
jgi:hypothetical protein